MVKEERPIFLKTVVIIVGLLLIEAGTFFYYFPPKNLSGYSIVDLTKVYSEISPSSKIFLVIQWAVIAIIIIIVFFKNRGIWRRKTEKAGINIDAIMKKSKTNLDALYTLLQEKKQMSTKSISDLFKIKEDLAMEWIRILESGDLVTIEYPGIGSPMAIIKTDQNKKEGEKEEEKKDSEREKEKQSHPSEAKSKENLKTEKKIIKQKKELKASLKEPQKIQPKPKETKPQKTTPESKKAKPQKVLSKPKETKLQEDLKTAQSKPQKIQPKPKGMALSKEAIEQMQKAYMKRKR